MENPETVTFDVGGRLFKVSRNVIEQFSDTMLGKIVSETWQHDSDATVFIDRDGDIFAHVLNYLRYGSIMLPISISRAMFDRDMDYYGIITDVNAHTIKQESSIHALDVVKNKLEDAELEHDMFIIAVNAYHKYMTGHKSCFFNEDSKIGLCRNPFDHSTNPRLNAKKILKEHLKTYYGIDAWSITFSSSQPTKNPFSSKSAFPPTRVISSGVNLNLRNGAERRPIESRHIDDTPFGRIDDTPFASGLLQEGEWYCNSCTTKNPTNADTCLACDTAKYERFGRTASPGRLPSFSFGG